MKAIPALERDRRYLETARLALQAGDPESCVSRAYYAMFFMSRALLRQHGLASQTHSGLINQFGRHFVKTGHVPLSLAKTLGDAFDLRQLAEYAEAAIVPEDEAAALLEEAEVFVNHLAKMLT